MHAYEFYEFSIDCIKASTLFNESVLTSIGELLNNLVVMVGPLMERNEEWTSSVHKSLDLSKTLYYDYGYEKFTWIKAHTP